MWIGLEWDTAGFGEVVHSRVHNNESNMNITYSLIIIHAQCYVNGHSQSQKLLGGPDYKTES